MARKKYSEDFKIQIVIMILKKYETASNLSKLLKINYNTIYRWVKKYNF